MSHGFPLIRLHAPLDLVADILAEAGAGPDAEEIAAAPRIDVWQPVLNPIHEICLIGRVIGHPRLGAGARWVVTSQLVLLDQPAGWCRTMNRYYRLGHLSEVRGLDMPPGVRFPAWARMVDVDQVGPLLAKIASAVHLACGTD